MATVHTIRLRGPWGCQPLTRHEPNEAGESRESTANLPPAGRLRLPADWSGVCGADFRGCVRLRRRFHWPARLMPRERVWLVLEEVTDAAVVRLNEEVLGEFTAADAPRAFDVTDVLEPTNVLLVDVTYSPDGPGGTLHAVGGLTGEVRLEVRTR
jgi:hypothetical protein